MLGALLLLALAFPVWWLMTRGMTTTFGYALGIMQAVGALPGALLVYVGASRWADPSLVVNYSTYDHDTVRIDGKLADVSRRTGSASTTYSPSKAKLTMQFGFGAWLLAVGASALARCNNPDEAHAEPVSRRAPSPATADGQLETQA